MTFHFIIKAEICISSIPGEGVEVNNSQVSCNTSSAPKQNKEQPVKQQSSKSKQSKQKKENIELGKEPSSSGNNKSGQSRQLDLHFHRRRLHLEAFERL